MKCANCGRVLFTVFARNSAGAPIGPVCAQKIGLSKKRDLRHQMMLRLPMPRVGRKNRNLTPSVRLAARFDGWTIDMFDGVAA